MEHSRTILKFGVRPGAADLRLPVLQGGRYQENSSGWRDAMRIHLGCDLHFEFPQITPMIVTLNVHFSRVSGTGASGLSDNEPAGSRRSLPRQFWKLVQSPRCALQGIFVSAPTPIIGDSGLPDPIDLNAVQHQVRHLPAEVILFLLGSRYCETDRLADEAWRLFGQDAARLAAGTGCLRLRPQSHNIRLRAFPRHQNGI